ncbi:MAG: alpha-D-ribose 1-methylphosphonate 5-triphosphate diphosphatase [Pseudomonadota bacterium]
MLTLIAKNTTVTIDEGCFVDARGKEVRCPDLTLRPGIVDFHGDGFERHLAPRRGALKDLSEGLIALDAELAANGITTAVLAQFWSWEGGMRGPDFARRLIAALEETRPRLLTDMRLQLRLETALVEDFDAVAALAGIHDIAAVVFNDHLPHDALAQGKPPPRLHGQALKAGRSPEAHWALLQGLYERQSEVPEALSTLSARLRSAGLRLGSHDDESAEGRAAYRALGATIAEFPTTEEALSAARQGGDIIVLGAPNVVRGGSHKKRLSAGAAVARGLCDVLVSDYHYPAPRRAALMVDDWSLVSEAPARVLGLTDRGRLEPGLRADLTLLDAHGRVTGTMVAGRWSYISAPLADLLI